MKKTKTQAFANLIGSLIFIAVGVWALIQTYSFQEVKNTYVQAAVFPQIMCVGMLIFAVILLIQSIIKLMTMDENDPLAEPAASINFIKDKGVLAALFVMLLCALFVVFFKPLGYVVCGAVLCFVIMVLIGKRNWLQMVLVSILVPLGMWLVFYKMLSVNIPMGVLQPRLDFRHPDSRAGHPGRGGHAAGRLPDVPEGSGGQGAFRRHVRVLRRRRHRRADYDLPLPDHCGYGHELRPRRNVHAGGLRPLRDRRHLRQVHRQGSGERLLRHAAVHRRPRPDQRHPALHHL